MDGQERYHHWQEGLVSIIVPVLELKRKRRLRYPLAPRRNISDLLEDLVKTEGVETEVIVVCNSREDDLVGLIAADSRVDKYCLNSVNAGVARSWNMGAMMAEGEFLCFLNDDVAIKHDSIAILRDALTARDDIGQVGPEGALWTDLEPGRYVGQEDMEEADAISGYAFMVKRPVFDQAGGFDVTYTPAGVEEIDFSFSVREAGYKCLVVPRSGITHHGTSGVSSMDTTIDYFNSSIGTFELSKRNRAIFRKKWSGND